MSLASLLSRGVLTVTVPYCFVISLRSTAAYCNAGMVYLGFKCKCSLERSTNIYLDGGVGGGGRGSGQQTLLRRFSLIPPLTYGLFQTVTAAQRELDLDDDLTDQDGRV